MLILFTYLIMNRLFLIWERALNCFKMKSIVRLGILHIFILCVSCKDGYRPQDKDDMTIEVNEFVQSF